MKLSKTARSKIEAIALSRLKDRTVGVVWRVKYKERKIRCFASLSFNRQRYEFFVDLPLDWNDDNIEVAIDLQINMIIDRVANELSHLIYTSEYYASKRQGLV